VSDRRRDIISVMPFKPANYTSVAPYLIVEGAQRVVDFMKQTFSATDLRRYASPEGRIFHAELRIDDTVVMIADSGPQAPRIASCLHVYVDDVDAVYKRAIQAGGTSIQEPTRREGEPDKRGGVRDPGGNSWWIATQIE
jgi:PhnB protein